MVAIPKVVGYVRVSTDRQADQGSSLEAQEAKIRGMATVQSVDLFEVIVDGGPPPDGRSVRYFQISRKFTGGWMVVGTSDSYNYFRELIP